MTMDTFTGHSPPAWENAPALKIDMAGIAYDGIPPVRRQVIDFIMRHGLGAEYAGMVALTVTEILTNLAKHPQEKATQAGLRLTLSRRTALVDIFDNSTPFAEFDAKCKTALSRLNAAGLLAESGYGLGLILKQHSQVSYTPAHLSPDGLNHFRVRGEAAASGAARPTVYLVDDDPVAMKRHCMMLEELYTLVPFGRAEELVKSFASAPQRPDIVVSDINMPGMDGLGLRLALSELEGGNTTPFIFLSAQAASETSPYISELGVDDFLCKPVNKDKLRAVVARLIARSKQVRQALEGRFQQHLTSMLRPDLPTAYEGWRIVTLTEAAEAGGGDFTLYHRTGTHMLAVLADVMGHGPEAKFFSYAYAGYLRSLFRQHSSAADPAAFLLELSRAIDGDAFLESVILTCQGFQLFHEGRAAIASAGHPAPMLVRASGAEVLQVAGPLPALGSVAGYQLHAHQLQAGEKLLFMTDGFLQPFDAEGFRRGTLLKLLDAFTDAPAPEMAEGLWHAWSQRRPQRGRDDATLIIAEYGGAL